RAAHSLLRKSLLRSRGAPRKNAAKRRRNRPSRAALSAPFGAARRDCAAPRGGKARLVPGGIAEHGGLVLDCAATRGDLRAQAPLCRPGRLLFSIGRPPGPSSDRTRSAPKGRLCVVAATAYPSSPHHA